MIGRMIGAFGADDVAVPKDARLLTGPLNVPLSSFKCECGQPPSTRAQTFPMLISWRGRAC
jgi:hypothetical protein